MAMKMKNMKMPAPKSAKDPMLEMDEMDMEMNLPDAMAEEDSAEEMDMGEESQEEASQLADVSDEELQKELEARGFSISKAEAEMDMEESEEEEA